MRRGIVVLILGVVLALSPPLDGGPADAKRKSRTVTRTVANGETITIPEASTFGKSAPYPSIIQVSGFRKGKIRDLDVSLRGLSHTEPHDIDVLLVGPNGTTAAFMSDVGGDADASGVTLRFTDDVNDGPAEPLQSGTWRSTNLDGADTFPAPAPAGSISNAALIHFNGSNPNGQWRLFVVDDNLNNTGEIADGWALHVKAKVKVKKKK